MSATTDLADPARGRLVARLLDGPLRPDQADELPDADVRALRDLRVRGHVDVAADGSVHLAAGTRARFLDRLLAAVLSTEPDRPAPVPGRRLPADADARASVPGAVHPAR
ncbi:hypothetical protein [Cellulomonas sp. C5510]|uniref:hypothetical protein n=1 Tax=Cellulomonas sp. C5510 TaxID=2871170 RepID=UPI001C9849D0|nr:hypothetical protein [Cellulomonas sp. C5510]QZN85340.1 hypothetical protein K5O09_16480 [Cellulomonas sp. C5510]